MLRACILAGLAALFGAALPSPALAHATPFSNIVVDVEPDRIEVEVLAYGYDFAQQMGLPEARIFDGDIAGSKYETLAAFVASRVTINIDGRPIALVADGGMVTADRKAASLRFHAARGRGSSVRVNARLFPYDPLHESFVSIRERGRLAGEGILTADRASMTAALQGAPARLEVFQRFLASGIEHIAIGPDHILFLVGLLLLGGTPWQLVRIVSGFTLAHSITLSLAVLNIVSPPARLIEPAIALSICAVAIHNLLLSERAKRANPRERSGDPGVPASERVGGFAEAKPPELRTWMAFGFGFVHGFGFANVLRALDLPRAALGWSLFAFNLGVEIGQLAIVIVVSAALAWIASTHAPLRQRIAVAGSVVVLWAGFFWFVQRVFFV